MHEKIKKHLARWGWQEYVLIGLAIFLAVFFTLYVSQYKQIPSPVYGGDVYRDRGFVKNIAAGNPIWSDSFYANEINYYGYLIPAIEAGIANIFNLSVDFVFLYFTIIIIFASCFAWYFLGKKLFGEKKWGLLTVIAFFSIYYSIFLKFWGAIPCLFIPLILYFWIRFEENEKIYDGIITGALIGLVSLVYGGTFAALVIAFFGTIALFFINDLIKEIKTVKEKNNHPHGKKETFFKIIFKTILEYIKKYYFAIISLIAISAIYFLPLYLKYRMHIVNNVPAWGDIKIEALGLSWFFSMMKNMFFNYANILLLILSLVSLFGLIMLVFSKRSKKYEILFFVFLMNIITTQHYLITRPLTGLYFWPIKLELITILIPLFFVLGVKGIEQYIKNKKTMKWIMVIVIILLCTLFIVRFTETSKSQWETYGRSDNTYMTQLYGLADYIENNVPKDQTILSNDETGFMLSVLSGRKVVLTRRTHASYYVDIDERIADMSVAMYGEDINLTKKLLEKYNTHYLYLDGYIFQYSMRTRPEFKDYLTQNQINFTEAYDRYDIAASPDIAVFLDLLIIPPQPFNPEFIGLWDKVYEVSTNGQVIGQLYKLKE